MATMLHDLTVYLGTTSTIPLSLKELIQDQFPERCIPPCLTLTITLAPQITMTLLDDLIDYQDVVGTNIHHALTLVVPEASSLSYSMRFVPTTLATGPGRLTVVQADQNMIIEKDINVRLTGKHAHATVACACYGDGSRTFKFTTLQEHCVEQTSSNLTIKNVIDDRASVFSKNVVQINHHAQHCDVRQTTKNILMSQDARAFSVPQLEIQANDVICKHGAATSSLHDDQIFYLQSRGVDDVQTRRMLIQAFLQ